MVTSNKASQPDNSQSTVGQTPRYAAFNSTKVLICGYPDDVVTAMCLYVEREGGKVWKKYYKGARPDVIICGDVSHSSCKEARRVWLDAVPVVTATWVEACAKRKAQVETGPYKLKPLVGLSISFTNYNGQERAALQKLVEAAGGAYSAELNKGTTTHLVCKTGSGKKYSAALQWRNVHVVTDAWLKESVKLGYPAAESQFRVEPITVPSSAPGDAAGPAAAAAAKQPHAVSDSVMFGSNAKQAASTTTTNQQPQQQPEAEQQEGSSKTRTRRAAAAAAAASIEQQAGSKTRSSSQRLSQPPAAAAAEEPAAADGPRAAAEPAPGQAALPPAAAAAAASNSIRSRLAALGIPDPDAAPMFLERVVMWWCGVPPGSSEHLELQSILHAYAGVRFPVLSDATTHIMVGAHAQVEDLKAVQQYLNTCNRRVEVVSEAWLQLCHQEQRLSPADSRCRLQVNSLVRSAAVLAGAGASAAGLGAGAGGLRTVGSSGGSGGGVFANTASRGGPPSEAEKLEGVWVPEYWQQQPTDKLKLFDGCYFTLAAVQSYQAEHEKALSHIRRLGGKVFTADSTKPPLRWPKVFAVCPASLPREAETALTAADASFRLVHPSCRVTTHWMDMCVKHSELVRVTPRNPLLAPLRFALPLRDFANISVAVTGYKEVQRTTIEKLVLLLGGTFCKSLGGKQRATHLMLPRWGPDAAADGSASSAQQLPESTVKKIAYALKHKLEMVVSEWLLDCAAEGRRVQEGLYRPDGDINLQQLPAAGATQATGPTQLPVTQLLQQTQTQVVPASRHAPAAGAAGGARSPPSFLSSQAPLPRPPASRPAAGAARDSSTAEGAGSDAAGVAAAAAAPPKSNWFTANKINSKPQPAQQQQQQQPAAAPQPGPPAAVKQPQPKQQQHEVQQQAEAQPLQQQQQQGRAAKQPRKTKPTSPHKSPVQTAATPGRTTGRKRAAASGAAAASAATPGAAADQLDTVAAAAAVRQGEPLDALQPQHKRQCKQQQQQHGREKNNLQGTSAAKSAGTAVEQADTTAELQADATAAAREAAGASGASRSRTEAQQPPAAAVVAAAAAAGGPEAAAPGSEGPDAALEGMLSMLATYHNKDTNIPASQALVGDMLPDTLLSAGRGASGGCTSGAAGAGSGGGASGGVQSGGQGFRSKRRAGGLSRAASGGAGSGPESLDGAASEQGGSAAVGSAAPQLAPKRVRRSSAAAAAAGAAAAGNAGDQGQAPAGGSTAGAMLPPSRKAGVSGGALAGGSGGSRYSTRRSAMSTSQADVAFEPSQQVGYDVGENPEAMLAAASGTGARAQRCSAADEQHKHAMLARLSSLRSRPGS